MGIRDQSWQTSYSTADTTADGRPVDILHEFYIPALSHSRSYDRVAGYFRSTSLAAASQGFSAFVANGGKMRMVVGADLDGGDVAAVLAGEEERLARLLNDRLDPDQGWPSQVQNGVALLGWMVARGYLEIRVGLRVHRNDGRPIAFTDQSDGYVHDKFGILTDKAGDQVMFSGSLNESMTALVLNAESVEVACSWDGPKDLERVQKRIGTFQALWNDTSKAVRVLKLPEAVRQKLIHFAEHLSRPLEIDGTSCVPAEVEPPSSLERLRWHLIKDGPHLPRGRLVGMATAPIAPWPHQVVVARRLIEHFPASFLMCDEVGLGKTIEAGLTIRSLVLSGLAKRVLIAAPRSLTRQWQRELRTKFYLEAERAEGGSPARHTVLKPDGTEEQHGSASLFDPPLVIVSTGLMQRPDREAEVASARFDLCLVDEAHYARRKNATKGRLGWPQWGNLYKAIAELLRSRTRCMLLATATPMQLDAVEAVDLAQLTHRIGAFGGDPTLFALYYEILEKLVSGSDLTAEEWAFLKRSIDAVRLHDPLLWQTIDKTVLAGPTKTAAEDWLLRDRQPRGSDRRHVRRVVFGAAPLSRVMLRHGRPLLERYRASGQLQENLARREIRPIPNISFTPREAAIDVALKEYVTELAKLITELNPEAKTATGFYCSFLRLRFASSLFAIRQSLLRRRERVEATLKDLEARAVRSAQGVYNPDGPNDDTPDSEDEGDLDELADAGLKNRTPADLRWELDRLRGMLAQLDDLSETPSKMAALLTELNRRRDRQLGRLRQTVLFTRFFDTLTDIVQRLREKDPNLLIGTYAGRESTYTDPRTNQPVGVEREEVKQRFLRGEIDLLVCTDAAAEGLNLQTADLLINFDLPWNPMKVEQRVGRIDRIGQKYDTVAVLNLCYVDSPEQIIYGRLLERLRGATQIVGAQQFTMLPVTEEDFAKLASGEITEAELARKAEASIQAAKARTATMEVPVEDLFDIYQRQVATWNADPAPVGLDDIHSAIQGSAYLRSLGCVNDADRAKRVTSLVGIPGVPHHRALTTDRDLMKFGQPDRPEKLHFATYGDPVFHAVVEEITGHGLPTCIRRITVPVADLDTDVVGYLVAAKDGNGGVAMRLVTQVSQLPTLQIAEGVEIGEADVIKATLGLRKMARAEFAPALAITRLEASNRTAANTQRTLVALAARHLLSEVDRTSPNILSREALKQITETLANSTATGTIINGPRDLLSRLKDSSLFAIDIPKMGDTGRIHACRVLLTCAVEHAQRVMEHLGKAKVQQLSELIRRLDKDITDADRRFLSL